MTFKKLQKPSTFATCVSPEPRKRHLRLHGRLVNILRKRHVAYLVGGCKEFLRNACFWIPKFAPRGGGQPRVYRQVRHPVGSVSCSRSVSKAQVLAVLHEEAVASGKAKKRADAPREGAC